MDFNKTKMNKPEVIVLILSYNGKELLNDSIRSYLDNDYESFIVIVIDNGSIDGTKEFVENKWPEVFVLRTEKNLGYSGGFNFGLDYAFNQHNADYVLITNNDVKVDSKVISSLIETASSDEMIGFVTGKVYYYDNPNILQTAGYEVTNKKYWLYGHRGGQEEDKGQYDNIEELEYSDDIFMLVKKELYDDTKGYDLEFQFQAEQFDWQIRSKKLGYKLFYTPYAKIWHKESMTIGKTSPFKTYYNTRNTLVLRLKYMEGSKAFSFFIWYSKNYILIALLKVLQRGILKYHIEYFEVISLQLNGGFLINYLFMIGRFYNVVF